LDIAAVVVIVAKRPMGWEECSNGMSVQHVAMLLVTCATMFMVFSPSSGRPVGLVVDHNATTVEIANSVTLGEVVGTTTPAIAQPTAVPQESTSSVQVAPRPSNATRRPSSVTVVPGSVLDDVTPYSTVETTCQAYRAYVDSASSLSKLNVSSLTGASSGVARCESIGWKGSNLPAKKDATTKLGAAEMCFSPYDMITLRTATPQYMRRPVKLLSEAFNDHVLLRGNTSFPAESVCVNGSAFAHVAYFSDCNVYHNVVRMVHFIGLVQRFAGRVPLDALVFVDLRETSARWRKQLDPVEAASCTGFHDMLIRTAVRIARTHFHGRPIRAITSVGYGLAPATLRRYRELMRPDGCDAADGAGAVAQRAVCFRHAVIGMEFASLKGPKSAFSRSASRQMGALWRTAVNASVADAADVVFVSRTFRRRFLNEEAMLNETRAQIERANLTSNVTFSVVQMEPLSITEQIAAISRARVLIGLQGAAFGWCPLLPAGAVMFEINFPQHSDAHFSGVDRNPRSTFGDMTTMADVRHVVYRMPADAAVAPTDRKSRGGGDLDARVPVKPYGAGVACALCLGYRQPRSSLCQQLCDSREWS
jgi:hypothetical protein